MNRQRIQEAEAEAERFLSRIADLMDKAKEDGDFSAIECGSLESGALRRASMDLTRALARMRARQ